MTFIVATRGAAQETGIQLFDIPDPDQGIVHVISPELGIALPGLSLICPDSHTCTLGGLGALAWGVGSTEAEHALATSTLRVTRPKTMRVTFEGALPDSATAKDLILFAIRELSGAGGAGYAIEFAGPAIQALAVEARSDPVQYGDRAVCLHGLDCARSKGVRVLQRAPLCAPG